MRARFARRLLLALAFSAVLVVSLAIALSARYPCWRYSNAAWCGHFCDDDPCACPERDSVDAYGAGPGCTSP